MHPLHWVLLLLLLFFSATSTAQANIDSRFNVYWGNEPGNCAGHKKTLDRWLQEAIDLTKSSLQAFDIALGGNYPNDGYDHAERTKEFLKSFWGLDSGSNEDDINLVRERFNVINQWLQGNRNFPDSAVQPWLFCDGTGLQPKNRRDIAVEQDGVTEVQQADPETGQMGPAAIEDVERYKDLLFVKDSNNKYQPNTDEPYWSDTLKRYVMAPDGLQNGCASGAYIGYTNPQEEPRAMVVCIDAIEKDPTSEEEDPTPEEDTILGTFVPDLVLNPSNGAFSYFKPKSSTFLHEVFHLYYGNDQTPDSTYQLFDAQETIKNDPNTVPVSLYMDGWDNTDPEIANSKEWTKAGIVRRTPEIYMVFAVTCWTWFERTFMVNGVENRADLSSTQVDWIPRK
ncbi:hypothetical protein MPH_09245 [Macrophomina phaseolina MS6]|uniref:Uncharacterized protein n=1 Tax=Macrophomina phaseolina (strain MS6) TaxID=1126212 RepID=K2QVB5_MACPH|nr:hypothetical protein MPH_09245 [Macrophomina phaseolina MS6]